MMRILSGDLPRSRVLAILLIIIAIGLVAAPLVFPGARSLNVAAKVAVFVLLVASYDLLLGYTGIVSFAHTMFFGIGGYGIGIAAARLGATWGNLALGLVASLALTLAIALVIGLLSLRVRTIFFAMITLAVAAFFQILASQLSDFTGGEDGLNFRLPALLQNRLVCYYLVLALSAALFLVLLRIVNSPFGRVLQSIRENEFRAEALGYRTVLYRTTANCLGALFAALAGALYALWLRYTGPDTTLSFAIMIDLLLMVVIGGMGTLYGAVIGAFAFVLVQEFFSYQDIFGEYAKRWQLAMGGFIVLVVLLLPQGLAGLLDRLGRKPAPEPRDG